jgi:hypothetical protein
MKNGILYMGPGENKKYEHNFGLKILNERKIILPRRTWRKILKGIFDK